METPLAFSPAALPISLDLILALILLILVVIFAVHSVVVTYHWITYAQNKAQAFSAALLHTGVGALLLISMAVIVIF